MENQALARRAVYGMQRGLMARTIERLVKRVANRAAISRPCSPHILRHTFAVTASSHFGSSGHKR